MLNFSKLFEILPDAEHLLSLSAEELAGPLLVSFEGSDKIIPENAISYDPLEREINGNSDLNYPHGTRDKVLFALMEAWQDLVCEGFIAPRPTQLAKQNSMVSATSYFVTRRGKDIETLEDFKAYRKADLLRKHQLHPIIAEKVWSIFAQGSYGTAVLEAFKQVEVAVRETGGFANSKYGIQLMSEAFAAGSGNLTEPSQHPAEQEARKLLFMGAIGAYKNPSSHQDVEFTPEETAEIIIIASHLLRIVDSRRSPDGD